MTDTTPHRATAEQWACVERWAALGTSTYSSLLLELRARVEALEGRYATTMAALIQAQHERKGHLHRIEALEAGATCPHIVSSDEGTSYCGLAEQQATDTPPEPAPAGSLIEAVHIAIATAMGHGPSEARAAIRAVAEWLEQFEFVGAAHALHQEVNR
jgi:hypothetical protein